MAFLLSPFRILSKSSNNNNGNNVNEKIVESEVQKAKIVEKSVPEVKTTTSATISSTSLFSSLKTKIFLRIRPSSLPNDIYSVEDSTTLIVKSPSNSYDSSRRPKPNNVKKFTFSKIFNSDVGQDRFFDSVVRPAVIDFLNNHSSTIISYGTVDSGKTYTLFGTYAEPGLVPRCVEFLYSSLNCASVPLFKPKQFGSVHRLNEMEKIREIEAKDKLLGSKSHDKSISQKTYAELETTNNDPKQNNRDIFKDSLYSVWISFVEIYNGTIYDLLDVDETDRKSQLKLASDKNGSTYVQGMRCVCATSGAEAYEILCIGQAQLSTVVTSNYKSSRSHSIFIVRLLEYTKDSAPTDVKVSFF